jgi:hypothetical protein
MADPPQPDRDSPSPTPVRDVPPRASFGQVVVAVLWSFFGVRKGLDLHRDAASIRPLQLIVIGVAMAALLVVGVLVLVHFIVH